MQQRLITLKEQQGHRLATVKKDFRDNIREDKAQYLHSIDKIMEVQRG